MGKLCSAVLCCVFSPCKYSTISPCVNPIHSTQQTELFICNQKKQGDLGNEVPWMVRLPVGQQLSKGYHMGGLGRNCFLCLRIRSQSWRQRAFACVPQETPSFEWIPLVFIHRRCSHKGDLSHFPFPCTKEELRAYWRGGKQGCSVKRVHRGVQGGRAHCLSSLIAFLQS